MLAGIAAGGVLLLGALFFIFNSSPPAPEVASASPSPSPSAEEAPRPRASKPKPKRSPERRPLPSPSQEVLPEGRGELYRQQIQSYFPLDEGLQRTFLVARREGGAIREGRERWLNEGTSDYEGETFVAVQVSHEGFPDAPATDYYRHGEGGVYHYDVHARLERLLLPSPVRVGQTWSCGEEKRTATRLQDMEWQDRRLKQVLVIRVELPAGGGTEVRYLAPDLGLVRVRRVAANGDRVDKDLFEEGAKPVSTGPNPESAPDAPLDPELEVGPENPLQPDPVAPVAGSPAVAKGALSLADLGAYVLTPLGTRLTYRTAAGTSVQSNVGTKTEAGRAYQRIEVKNTVKGNTFPSENLISSCRNGIISYSPFTKSELVLMPAPLRPGQAWVLNAFGSEMIYTFVGKVSKTVPAGTYADTLQIRMRMANGTEQDTYYARGVGIIYSGSKDKAGKVSLGFELTGFKAGTGAVLPVAPKADGPVAKAGPAAPAGGGAAPAAGGAQSKVEELEELGKGWWLYTARDGSCTLEFPSKPTIGNQTQAGATGKKLESKGFAGSRWVFTHVDFPAGYKFSRSPDAVLKDISGSVIRGLSANRVTKVSERPIRKKGLKGRETTATLIYPQVRLRLMMKMFICSERMYYLMAIEQDGGGAIRKSGRRFFKSFKPIESEKKKR